ncbi:MAG: MFS transporter [Candidatus Eisenbacteria bacterium]|uniref:MFS transporter n=1 Tax=Eiseniibacteriota bacterium TaxID=2212470 RepID=A0A7Y2E5G3_UNCEI|nr:MFS transporter [Candidatus Eisenbacteria bacterium]
MIRILVAAFLMDMALYLTMTGAPYRALQLGAGTLVLGLLASARAIPYSLLTIWAGSQSTPEHRTRLTRIVLPFGAIGVLLLAFVSHVAMIFVLLAVLGVALAFFWPALMASVADRVPPKAMARAVGWFNLAWSSGKGVGFLCGGILLERAGFFTVFLVAAALMMVAATLVGSSGKHEAVAPEEDAYEPKHLHTYRWVCWVGTAFTMGMVAVMNHHLPEWLEARGWSESVFGGFLGATFLTQTVAFVFLGRTGSWNYRPWPLILSTLVLSGVMLAVPFLQKPVWFFVLAPFMGVSMGLLFSSSLIYSLAGREKRGRNAGINEAFVGLGTVLFPVLGGLAGSLTQNLDAPYLFSAASGVGLILLQINRLSGK